MGIITGRTHRGNQQTSIKASSRPTEYIHPRSQVVAGALEYINTLGALIPSEYEVDSTLAKRKLSRPGLGLFVVRYALVEEGILASFRTPGWLEDHFHVLDVSTDKKVNYHRSPYNVDCQKVPSREINLNGAEDISKNVDAVMALSSITTALSAEQTFGWPRLIKL